MKENYFELMKLFNRYCGSNEILTIGWGNVIIVKTLSDLGANETDTDLGETDPEYPGEYFTAIKVVEVVKNSGSEEVKVGDYIEINMLNIPTCVKKGEEVLWTINE